MNLSLIWLMGLRIWKFEFRKVDLTILKWQIEDCFLRWQNDWRSVKRLPWYRNYFIQVHFSLTDQLTPSSTNFKKFDKLINQSNPCVTSKPCPQVLWQKSNSVRVLFISHQSIPSGATPKYMTQPRVLGGTRGGSFMEREEGGRGEGKWEGKQREEGPQPDSSK